jgi:glyoxalase family protein
MKLEGIHHVTAITGDARRNVDFYTRVLGMRLVAKSVNQDDPGVYHLFYGDEQARPGADLTFFEYPYAKRGRPGAGMIHRIVHRVGSKDALAFWAERLAAEGVETEGDGTSLRFADPETLAHELVIDASGDEPLTAVHPEVPAELALRGFEGVRAYSDDPSRSQALLESVMGARRLGDEHRYEMRGAVRGGWIAFDPAPPERGRQSAGIVHHVAWGTYDADLPAWIERFGATRLPNSGYVDRHYFHSYYVREPGGVLYELATAEPGFLVDGLPVEQLGTKIILPPFLEDRRAEIEARLTPLPDPRADWPTGAYVPSIAPGRVSDQITQTSSAITTMDQNG